jgi:hypothetical protein
MGGLNRFFVGCLPTFQTEQPFSVLEKGPHSSVNVPFRVLRKRCDFRTNLTRRRPSDWPKAHQSADEFLV